MSGDDKFKALYMADDLVRKIRINAMQEAVNIARTGKMNAPLKELDRGHNLALDHLIENLEKRIEEIEAAPVGLEGLTEDQQTQYPLLPDREKPQTGEGKDE